MPNGRSNNHEERHKRLGESSIPRLLFEFSLPAIVGMVVSASYNVIDRIFIGHGIDSNGIAGVTIGFPMMLVMMAFSMLIGLGGAALISIKLGEQKKNEAELVLGNGFVLLVINALLVTFFGLVFMDPLLRIFGASKDVMPYARDYMTVIISGTIFQSLSFGGNAYIRAEGNPRIAMATMLIGAVMNAIFAPIFIFWFKWGMHGAGAATICAQAISAGWVLSYFLTGKSSLDLKRANTRLKLEIIGRITAIGSAPFAMQIAASMLMIVFNNSLEYYGGDTAIAAMGIVNAIAMLMMMPIFGINQGAQPIIGYNYGAKKLDRVIKTLRYAIFIATALVTTGYIFIRIFPTGLMSLFNPNDAELIRVGAHALTIFLAFLPLVGFQAVSSSYFLAVGKPKLSMLLTLSRQVIFLLPALLILPWFWKLNGIFMSGPFSDLLSSILTAIFIIREFRHLKRTHDNRQPLINPNR